ncbi:MAG TPA: hypothetical protein VJW23_11135, partial [Propionibacteriaceae bacterium]|nr:hypothetical protein [Propionibacteriaceae bacterium]
RPSHPDVPPERRSPDPTAKPGRYGSGKQTRALALLAPTGNGDHERAGGAVGPNYGPITDQAGQTQHTSTVNRGHQRDVIHA